MRYITWEITTTDVHCKRQNRKNVSCSSKWLLHCYTINNPSAAAPLLHSPPSQSACHGFPLSRRWAHTLDLFSFHWAPSPGFCHLLWVWDPEFLPRETCRVLLESLPLFRRQTNFCTPVWQVTLLWLQCNLRCWHSKGQVSKEGQEDEQWCHRNHIRLFLWVRAAVLMAWSGACTN